MQRTARVLALAVCLCGVAPALAVTYTANFDTGKEGWRGDGVNWSATGGQGDDGGHFFGERDPYGRYLAPPDAGLLHGDVASNFEKVSSIHVLLPS